MKWPMLDHSRRRRFARAIEWLDQLLRNDPPLAPIPIRLAGR